MQENFSKESEKNSVPRLQDFITIEQLQHFQDSLAALTGTSITTMTLEAEFITKPSNISLLCKAIRKTNEGLKRCKECDAKHGQDAIKYNQPQIYSCHLGLTDTIAPIYFDNKPVAIIFAGQFVRNKEDYKNIIKIVKKLDFKEEDYLPLINKIPLKSEEKIKHIITLLEITADKISDIATSRWENRKRSEILEHGKDKLDKLYKLSQELNSLDLQTVLNKTVKMLAQIFQSGSCTLWLVDEQNERLILNAACGPHQKKSWRALL